MSCRSACWMKMVDGNADHKTPDMDKYQLNTMTQYNVYWSGMCNAWSDTSAGG